MVKLTVFWACSSKYFPESGENLEFLKKTLKMFKTFEWNNLKNGNTFGILVDTLDIYHGKRRKY